MQLPRKMSVNVMASISRSLGNRNDGNGKHSNEIKLAGEESKDKLYEPKHRQKVVRVLTVVAYVVSVSLAAIILSLYYTFIWDPKDHAALYTLSRQTSLNSTSKIECLNVTIPVFVEHARTINGSNVSRGILTIMPLITNETRDIKKSEGNLSVQISTKLLKISSTEEDVESSVSPPIMIEPETLMSDDEEHDGETEERLTKDTSDFDFV